MFLVKSNQHCGAGVANSRIVLVEQELQLDASSAPSTRGPTLLFNTHCIEFTILFNASNYIERALFQAVI
jgi:hypothetical protein